MTNNNENKIEKNLLNNAFLSNQGIHHHFLNDCYHLQVELEEIRKQLYESKAKANMLQAENDSLRGVIQELQTINESVDPNIIFRKKRRKTKKNKYPLLNFNVVNEYDQYFNPENNFFEFNGNGTFKLPNDLTNNTTKKNTQRKKKTKHRKK